MLMTVQGCNCRGRGWPVQHHGHPSRRLRIPHLVVTSSSSVLLASVFQHAAGDDAHHAAGHQRPRVSVHGSQVRRLERPSEQREHLLLCLLLEQWNIKYSRLEMLAVNGLTVLVGYREEHPACEKNWVMRCWHGYSSGARYNWLACGPADAIATLSSLASLKSRLV